MNDIKTREFVLLELKNIRRSRVEMDVVPAVLFESFFIFPNFYTNFPAVAGILSCLDL